ncbi:MAG: phosphonate ABC transporter ATP-binding protein, partial [Paenibacillaceae bacterium]|nr:phosphonate ABC transporter ATP-binding protein [Paenibacillaceae bacterium]
SAERVLETLKELCTQQDKIVIAALPLEYAERYCTRIWGLLEGELKLDVSGRRLTPEDKRLIDLA